MSAPAQPSAPTPTSAGATLVAIGNFDGVHRGHQAVLSLAAARARESGLRPIVLTFEPHPADVLGRGAPPTLTRLARKIALVEALDADLRVVVQGFDTAFASLSPSAFAAELLRGSLDARAVVVGENFRFGHERAGDFRALRELGDRLGFGVEPAPVAGDARGKWSSSRVRAALSAGDLPDAGAVLGRPHALEGVVVRGQGRARGLGFPTANLGGVREALPPYGVYAVEVERLENEGGVGQRVAGGVVNIGLRPTFQAGFAVEAHLFDWSGDLYGSRLRLVLRAALRRERAFAGVDDLRAQIALDADAARRALTGGMPHELPPSCGALGAHRRMTAEGRGGKTDEATYFLSAPVAFVSRRLRRTFAVTTHRGVLAMRRSRHHLLWSLLPLALASTATGCTVHEYDQRPSREVVVEREPPVERTEVVTVAPSPAHVWVRGHWTWDSYRGEYAWVGGRWEARPHATAQWVHGYWTRRARGWVWIEGHWS